MKCPYAVVFAGAPGSSKSIVAHHLSVEFNLPILNRDIIRSEVKEEFLVSNINEPKALKEFEKRFNERWHEILARKQNVILDGSVDRSWSRTKQKLEAAGYAWFMIDMELSKKFFVELFTATKRPKAIDQLDMYLEQHENFLKKYDNDISVKVTDKTFKNRLSVTETGLRDFLSRS
jgi:predicted kinase